MELSLRALAPALGPWQPSRALRVSQGALNLIFCYTHVVSSPSLLGRSSELCLTPDPP